VGGVHPVHLTPWTSDVNPTSIVGRFLTKVPGNIKRVIRHVGPIIQERLAKRNPAGAADVDPDDEAVSGSVFRLQTICVYAFCPIALRQNDLISWLISEAPESQRTVRALALRVLTVNFAAIHTTSMVRPSADIR
jgi:ubiquinone biosynthesis protein UbiJ